jgi:hypothetical protein
VNRRLRLAPLLAIGALAAGCGSAATTPALTPGTPSAAGAPPSLATAVGTSARTWAVVVMGGAAAQHNNFWQLFVRPSSAGSWRLATPPGVASNGGLVIAPAGGRSLTAGFRPSQSLVFTPLAVTTDGGSSWSSSVLNAGLANVPDALAAAPGTGRLLALLTDGTAEISGPGAGWTPLVTRGSLAATGPGGRCGLRQLTAAAFSGTGVTLLAGACTHPGNAGIFALTGGAWSAAGPALPAVLARQPVTVLRLTTTPAGVVALLQAGTGPSASVLAAWSADGGSHWDLSAPYRLGGDAVSAASFGPGSAVAIMLTGGRGVTIGSAGGRWQALPPLPPGTATLAAGPGSAIDALAVSRATLTVWQARPGGTAWTKAQTIKVPVQYGSSG